MKSTIWIVMAVWIAGCIAFAQGRGERAQSPASTRPPQTKTSQTYPADQVQAGQARFTSQCALCHGRDAGGTDTGPDLTRSTLVSEDNRGDKIEPVIRSGRASKGMPAFELNDTEIAAIVAFIHDQKKTADQLEGGRRSVDVADLVTGNAEAGQQYFSGAGNCSKCHSATGDLAGIGGRLQGLALLQRMLYPGGRGASSKITINLETGETLTGPLVSRDEFSVVMTDAAGMRRTFSVKDIKFTIDSPLQAHFEALGKYTDADMHNVYAYLSTLR